MSLILSKKAAPTREFARQSLRGPFAMLARARALGRSLLSRFRAEGSVVAEVSLPEPAAWAVPESAVAGAPIDRLWAWGLARLEDRRAQGLGEEFWRARTMALFHAALAAWVREEPFRPVEGFFAWMDSVESLASWVAEREGEEADEALLGVKRYLGILPGYTQGQPATVNALTMHGYLTMQFFCPSVVARYVERCCDDPDALRALARAGFEPLQAPSEDRAWEAFCWLERQEIEQETAVAATTQRETSRRI